MPAGNKKLGTLARAKRGLSEAEKLRGSMAGRLLRNQLRTYGVSLDDLYHTMSLSAKTTLKNHINNGSITLAELLIVNDYYPININAILDGMRTERTPKPPLSTFDTVQQAVTDDTHIVDMDDELSPEELAFAASMGIDVQ